MTWDHISTFVSVSPYGYDAATDDIFDLNTPPVDLVPAQQPAPVRLGAAGEHAVAIASLVGTEQLRRLQDLSEKGWVDADNGNPFSPLYTPMINAYLDNHISYDDCERGLLAAFFADMDIPGSIRDD